MIIRKTNGHYSIERGSLLYRLDTLPELAETLSYMKTNMARVLYSMPQAEVQELLRLYTEYSNAP